MMTMTIMMITITMRTTIIIMLLLILKNTMIVKQLLLILTLIKKKKKKKLKREHRIKISDVRISPHATQRKHLAELLIIRDGDNKHFQQLKIFRDYYQDQNMIEK